MELKSALRGMNASSAAALAPNGQGARFDDAGGAHGRRLATGPDPPYVCEDRHPDDAPPGSSPARSSLLRAGLHHGSLYMGRGSAVFQVR